MKHFKSLPQTHPYLYEKFSCGNFVVKTSKGGYNGVAADMKLEQRIKRLGKSTHGIIGQTHLLQYVTDIS